MPKLKFLIVFSLSKKNYELYVLCFHGSQNVDETSNPCDDKTVSTRFPQKPTNRNKCSKIECYNDYS